MFPMLSHKYNHGTADCPAALSPLANERAEVVIVEDLH
jgi:hypothetical protein